MKPNEDPREEWERDPDSWKSSPAKERRELPRERRDEASAPLSDRVLRWLTYCPRCQWRTTVQLRADQVADHVDLLCPQCRAFGLDAIEVREARQPREPQEPREPRCT